MTLLSSFFLYLVYLKCDPSCNYPSREWSSAMALTFYFLSALNFGDFLASCPRLTKLYLRTPRQASTASPICAGAPNFPTRSSLCFPFPGCIRSFSTSVGLRLTCWFVERFVMLLDRSERTSPCLQGRVSFWVPANASIKYQGLRGWSLSYPLPK